jgi:hypothetical protein
VRNNEKLREEMKRMRTFALAAIVAASMTVAPLARVQQDYPNRLVNVVNPTQAGATTDVLARVLVVGLSSRLGQQFVVVNRTGASGAIGTASVARAAPDGYTLLFGAVYVLSVLPAARSNDIGYDAHSLIPVCQTVSNAMVIAVRPQSPFHTLADLVAAARAEPGKLNYGHQGAGSIPHLAMEEFLETAKLDIKGIPGRGDPAVVTDLLAGNIDAAALVQGTVNGTEFAPARHFCRGAAPVVCRHADREGAGLRRGPDQLRRIAGAGGDAERDRRQARDGVCGRGPGRDLCECGQTGRPAAELLRRPRHVRGTARS